MAPVKTFAGIVNLVRRAEALLVTNAGQTDPADRASTLRGIYYGTEWSLDYKVEKSLVRNLGFITYTGGNVSTDPRPAFAKTTLFNDLQKSQNIFERGRQIDIGHVLIGLETRNNKIMRTVQIAGQGGTGLEIVTWLGDLGGGAANLAKRRIQKKTQRVDIVFNNKGSDYGVTDNLEGDVGGYLVACDKNPGGPPVYGTGKGVADVLESYFMSIAEWNTRATRFVKSFGGTVGPGGITNANMLISTFADKIHAFALWYASTRWVPSGELRGVSALTACTHMQGAAREVATVFVAALSRATKSGPIKAIEPYPVPSAPSSCTFPLLQQTGSLREQLEEWRKGLGKLFN